MTAKNPSASRVVVAVRLAARKQGVTAAQLAEESGLTLRSAQKLLKTLYDQLHDPADQDIVMVRETSTHGPLVGRSPGRTMYVYFLRKP